MQIVVSKPPPRYRRLISPPTPLRSNSEGESDLAWLLYPTNLTQTVGKGRKALIPAAWERGLSCLLFSDQRLGLGGFAIIQQRRQRLRSGFARGFLVGIDGLHRFRQPDSS